MWHLGRGLHALNPLDAGPLRAALRTASHSDRTRLAETLRARRLSLLEALITIVRRDEPDVTERRLLGRALDLAVDTAVDQPVRPQREPLIPDVLTALLSAAPAPASVAASADDADYRRQIRPLDNALALLCEGPSAGIFDRPPATPVRPDTPALSLDISALDDDDDDVVAAAMLCSWAWSALRRHAAAYGTWTRRRNVVQVQDELWRALRVAPGLVERSDRITRLGRHRGSCR